MNWLSRKNLLGAGVVAAIILAVLPWRSFEQPVAPEPAAARPALAAEHCKVGIYIVDLHDLDISKKLFDANFWVWSQCARENLTPLKTMEFVNANRVVGSLDQMQVRDGIYWSARKIDGTFRHDWNVRNFPFDRHVLRISIEEGMDDGRTFLYEPDLPASGYDRRIVLPGWKLEGFRLLSSTRHYETTFGDPTVSLETPVEYSRLDAEIRVVRASLTSFLKMTSAVYVAATLALLSFLFHLDTASSFSSRISFLAGSLFATVVNMRVASSELGSNDGLTLIDNIHITALILVIAATILTILADRRMHKGKAENIRHFDRVNMAWCAGLFVAANAVLIGMAILAERA
jgi:hypothetical protein